MPGLVHFLGCIGRAAIRNSGRALISLLPFGETAFDIARDACEEFRRDHGEEQLRQEMMQLRLATAAEVHQAARKAAKQTVGSSLDLGLGLVSYLNQLPTLAGSVNPPSEAIPRTIQAPRHAYELRGLLAQGDVADIYVARRAGDKGDYLVKRSRIQGGAGRLQIEHDRLTALQSAAGETTYRHYLPQLVESFTGVQLEQRWSVFRHTSGYYTLEQIHEQHPQLDARHLGWIFKRLLEVLGFIHRQGIVHAALLPPHVLLQSEQHGLRLVGWGQSVQIGRPVQAILARYRDWYPPEVLYREGVLPATDLFAASRCLIYLAGGNPLTGQMPDGVPMAMQRFLRSCLLERPGMRPSDAWALCDEWDDLLKGLFGPRKYHPLCMS